MTIHHERYADFEGSETGADILPSGSDEGKEWYAILSAPDAESARERALLKKVADQYRH